MARPIAAPAKPDTSDDELPAEMHPDAWRRWLPEVNDEPTTEFEKDIAYSDGWTANPFGSTAEKRAYDLPTPVEGWREEVAAQLQWRARDDWRAAQ
ncbi:MAG: hypothetical protein WBB62_08205 [Rhodococcus sp. (in: high G+C Gram-positive bacteria)]